MIDRINYQQTKAIAPPNRLAIEIHSNYRTLARAIENYFLLEKNLNCFSVMTYKY